MIPCGRKRTARGSAWSKASSMAAAHGLGEELLRRLGPRVLEEVAVVELGGPISTSRTSPTSLPSLWVNHSRRIDSAGAPPTSTKKRTVRGRGAAHGLGEELDLRPAAAPERAGESARRAPVPRPGLALGRQAEDRRHLVRELPERAEPPPAQAVAGRRPHDPEQEGEDREDPERDEERLHAGGGLPSRRRRRRSFLGRAAARRTRGGPGRRRRLSDRGVSSSSSSAPSTAFRRMEAVRDDLQLGRVDGVRIPMSARSAYSRTSADGVLDRLDEVRDGGLGGLAEVEQDHDRAHAVVDPALRGEDLDPRAP